MSASPTKENIPTFAPPKFTGINAPPSPRHRALRRLQSAQTLRSDGSPGNSAPSLIAQQHIELSLRRISPTRKDPSQPATLHTRARSNSDAPSMPGNNGIPGKRPALAKKMLTGETFSLDRLIRDGPPDGDLAGGLDAMRLKILDQGIKSDSDGMVRTAAPKAFT